MTYFCDFRDFCVTLWSPRAVYELGGYEVGLGTGIGVLGDIVGEEENLQDKEDDDKLHNDDSPQGATHRHVTEAIIVKMNCSI